MINHAWRHILKTRVLTALILLPLLIAAIIWLPLLYFTFVLAAFLLIGAWEWSALAGLTQLYEKVLYLFLIAAALVGASFLNITLVLFFVALYWLWILVGVVSYQLYGMAAGFQLRSVRFITGFPVLMGAWVAVMSLKTHPGLGSPWLLLVLAIIFAADTGAYFSGRFFGKKLLCSKVSPKKTWEGFFGGLVLSLCVAVIGGYYFALPLKFYFSLMIVALLTFLFSVIGDLGVSLLKRVAGLKDSGKIFPGHGGLLDRLDSVASATVFFVLLVLIL